MSNPNGPLPPPPDGAYQASANHSIGRENPFARLLRGVGGALQNIGGYMPDILQGVAAGLAAAQWGQSGGGQPIYNDPNLWNNTSYRPPTPLPGIKPIQPTPIPQYQPSTTARDALRRVESQRPQVHQPRGYIGSNPLTGMVNQAAPNPIHQSQQSITQAPYTEFQSHQGYAIDGILRALDPNFGRGPSQAIPDNSPWVQNNLAYAQRPVTQAEMHAIRQQQALQVQHQQAMNAQIATSRAQRELAEMQLREMRHRQYQEAQAAQPKRLVNTRPLNESPALHQMMMRSNEARSQAQPKPLPKAPPFHDVEYLNRRQKLLNRLFRGQVFNRTERQYPYDAQNGQKVDDRNIAQMAAVADWILFGQQTNGQWSNEKVERLTRQLDSGEYWIPPKIERQLDLARQLNDILKRNEELDSHRNDAKALAEGMQLLIRENTLNGKVNTVQLIEDIQLFTIDAGTYELGRLTGQATQSNAAYNLFAGPRIGTVGWKEKYWDFGQQYSSDGRLVNQAHHFTFFFTKGLLAGSDAAVWVKHRGAEFIDRDNVPDQELGKKAIDLGQKAKTGEIQWKDVPRIIYQELKE